MQSEKVYTRRTRIFVKRPLRGRPHPLHEDRRDQVTRLQRMAEVLDHATGTLLSRYASGLECTRRYKAVLVCTNWLALCSCNARSHCAHARVLTLDSHQTATLTGSPQPPMASAIFSNLPPSPPAAAVPHACTRTRTRTRTRFPQKIVYLPSGC